MIPEAALMVLIMNFCGFQKASDYDKDSTKRFCFEFMNNCIRRQDKKTTDPEVLRCQELWVDQDVRRKKYKYYYE